MEKVHSTVCALLFAFVAIAHFSPASAWNRRNFETPGCPDVNSIDNCRYLTRCRSERHCGKLQNCCRSKCGLVCVDRESGASDSSSSEESPEEDFPRGPFPTAEKPGECPPVKSYSRSFSTSRCAPKCWTDFNCKGDDKCCPSARCGKQCQQPLFPREGECPVVVKRSRACSFPAQKCANDFQCPEPLKCCDYGCGRRCVPPRIVKPGSCPARCPRRLFQKCPNECLHDGCCPDNQKCCGYGCSFVCVAPARRW